MLDLCLPIEKLRLPSSVTDALVLADQMLNLAEAADRAGYAACASRLVQMAHAVFDEQPRLAAEARTH